MSNTFKFSSRSEKNLQGVNPDLVKVTRRALEISEVDFGITEGLRGRYRQKQLVTTGKSQTMNSRHLTGHAVDVVAYVGSQVSWEWPLYEKIAAAFRQASRELNIPVEWGGDWKTLKDGPHFQLPHGAIRHEALAHAGCRFPSDCRMGNIHASVMVAWPGERQKRSTGQHPEKYRRHTEYHQCRGTGYAAGAGATPRGKSTAKSGRRGQT